MRRLAPSEGLERLATDDAAGRFDGAEGLATHGEEQGLCILLAEDEALSVAVGCGAVEVCEQRASIKTSAGGGMGDVDDMRFVGRSTTRKTLESCDQLVTRWSEHMASIGMPLPDIKCALVTHAALCRWAQGN